MGFSIKQTQALRCDLDRGHVRTRDVNGRTLSYVEGWFVIAEANRIFGFDAWNRETVESKCIVARENKGAFIAVYIARVRITVQARGAVVIREGHGTGEGRGSSPGEVHDLALKAAETDATKRALSTFGNPFGLSLYGSGKTVPSIDAAHEPLAPSVVPSRNLPPDDTTPIPRPSRYYGRRQDLVTRDQAEARQQLKDRPYPETSIVPEPTALQPGKIDKSVLTIGEPKRHRDKDHLRFVASQPCLVCRHLPSDAHHLRFAQPRALGLKVSDEFTVPLCRDHHQQLHNAGNEVSWWHDLSIKPLAIAKELWSASKTKVHPS